MEEQDQKDPNGYDRAAVVSSLRREWCRRRLDRFARGAPAELEAAGKLLEEISDAAAGLEGCGRDFIYYECVCGGSKLVPRSCGYASLCPQCARREAARVSAVYHSRLLERQGSLPAWFKPRSLTLTLRPNEGETLPAVVLRCRSAAKTTLRLVYGIPSSGAEWSLMRQLHARQIEKLVELTAEETPGGRARSLRARRREAIAKWRSMLVAERTRRRAGWVVAVELGERGMKAHAHAVALAPYVDQKILARAWELVSGSYVVWITNARNAKEALKYPVKFTGRSASELVSVFLAFHGIRRLEAFGCLRTPSASERAGAFDPPPVECPECHESGMVATGWVPLVAYESGIRAPPMGCSFVHAACPSS